MFPGFPSLEQLHYWKQWWETQCEGYCHCWYFPQLRVLLPPIELTGLPWEHEGCLTCSSYAGCSEGNSTILQTPCVAKPARLLAASWSGRDVLNIVFRVSWADKSPPWLLPGLMWSHPWTQHKSLRRGWVSPSDRHGPAHALVGTFPQISINRLGWWLLQYLPPNICSFPFPWKNNIKRLKYFLLKQRIPRDLTEYIKVHIFYMRLPGYASLQLAIHL